MEFSIKSYVAVLANFVVFSLSGVASTENQRSLVPNDISSSSADVLQPVPHKPNAQEIELWDSAFKQYLRLLGYGSTEDDQQKSLLAQLIEANQRGEVQRVNLNYLNIQAFKLEGLRAEKDNGAVQKLIQKERDKIEPVALLIIDPDTDLPLKKFLASNKPRTIFSIGDLNLGIPYFIHSQISTVAIRLDPSFFNSKRHKGMAFFLAPLPDAPILQRYAVCPQESSALEGKTQEPSSAKKSSASNPSSPEKHVTFSFTEDTPAIYAQQRK